MVLLQLLVKFLQFSLILLLPLFTFNLTAQTVDNFTGKNIILNGLPALNQANDNIVRASESINLENSPGVIFDSDNSGKKLHLYIDPSLVNDQSFEPRINDIFTTSNISTENKVGAIPANEFIDAIGGFNYAIPILIPKGTNGVVPSISAHYNSSAGVGLLGEGWNISGLSSISRAAKSNYYDGVSEPIKYNRNDVFIIDGARLIKDGTNYYLENEDYSVFTPQPSSGSITSWTIEREDGTIVEYGKTTNSREIVGSDIVTWLITKQIDKNGNYIQFTYRVEDGQNLIDEIIYTGNDAASLQPYNKIKFIYNKTDYSPTKFSKGFEIKRHFLIDKIQVYSKNRAVFDYSFEYFTKRFSNLFNYKVPKLQKVELESLIDGTKYSPTTFEYDIGNTPFSATTNSTINLTYTIADGLMSLRVGDFNGDGMTDCLQYRDEGTTNRVFSMRSRGKQGANYDFSHGSMHPTLASTELDYTKIYDNRYSSGYSNARHNAANSNSSSVEYGNMYVYGSQDLSGDGFDDIIMLDTYYSGGTPYTNVKRAVSTAGGGFVLDANGMAFKTQDAVKFDFATGDYTGDGVADAIGLSTAISPGNPRHFKFINYISNQTRDVDFLAITFLGPRPNGWDENMVPIDFDGDGTVEIMCWGKNGTSISVNIFDIIHDEATGNISLNHIYRKNNFFSSLVATNPNLNYLVVENIQVGDYNGDGLTDFLMLPDDDRTANNNKDPKILINKGDQTFDIIEIRQFLVEDHWFFLDVNGDTYSDIIRVYESSVGNETEVTIYYSDGQLPDYSDPTYNFENTQRLKLARIPQTFDDLDNFSFGDFDGNGSVEMMFTNNPGNSDPTTVHIYEFNVSPEVYKLHRVRNGMDQDLEVEYAYNSDVTQRFSEFGTYDGVDGAYRLGVNSPGPNDVYGFNLNSDYIWLNKGLLLAHKIRRNVNPASPTSLYETERHTFFGAIFNRKGKGLIGMARKVESFTYDGASFIKNSTLNLSCNCILQDEVMRASYFDDHTDFAFVGLNTYDLRENYTFSITPKLSGKRYLLRKTFERYHDKILNVDKSTTYNYHTSGNLEGNILSTIVNDGIYQTTTTINSYGKFGTLNPEHPTSATIIRDNLSHAGVYSTTTVYDYYVEGNLKEKTLLSGTPKAIKEEYSYDTFGNLIQQITSSSGLPSQTLNSLYDDKGLNLLWTENIKGQRTEILSRDILSKVTKLKNPDGNIIRNSYDGFGSLVEATSPTGNKTIYSINWANPIDESKLYYKEVSAAGNPSTISYFDFLGREIETQIEGWSDRIVEYKEYFNQIGKPLKLIKRESLPKYLNSTEPLEFISYSYDDYHRLTGISHPHHGNNSAVSYSVLSNQYIQEETDFGNKIKKFYTNKSGELVKIVDNDNNSLDYYYNDQGNNIRVELNSQVVTSLEFDPHDGSQKKLIDNNSGETIYNYNAYGNLTSLTDPKGTTTYQYNNYNELFEESSSLGSINYIYNNSGNGINKIASITHSNGIADNYIYDQFGRLIQFEKTIDNQVYTFKSEYDEFGNTIAQTYPSGFTVKNEYTTIGLLKKVRNGDNNNIIWEGLDMNHLIQYTQISQGDGITTNYSYSKSGSMESISGGLDYDYTWNYNTNNLEKWENNNYSTFEDFTYDQLDRLEKISLNGILDKTNTYAKNGNILSKDDLTNYQYNNTKPNALIGLDDFDNIVSNTSQSIEYNEINQPSRITEGSNELSFVYGFDGQRVKSTLKENNVLKRERIYLPQYDVQKFNSTNREQNIHYIKSGNGLAAIYVLENNIGTMYYTYTDYLGSILKITDENGLTIHEQSFDAWGRKRNPSNWSYNSINSNPDWLFLGFTGHEYYEEFELVNMNGRVYDPVIGRMLSTDNNVQDPTNTQNFNRYSYAFNNPLKYTDPDGELFFIPMLAAAGVFMLGSSIDNVFNAKHYGHESFGDALKAGVNQGYNAFNIVNSNTTISIPISDNVSANIGLSLTGIGINGGLSYNDGNFGLTLGGGYSSGSNSFSGAVGGRYKEAGLTLSLTRYGISSTNNKPQFVGGANISVGQFSASIQNDFLAFQGEDRWRTAALEFTYQDFVIGNFIVTNDPEGIDSDVDFEGTNLRGNKHKFSSRPANNKGKKFGAWVDGIVKTTPLYLGYKFGNNVQRVGISHPAIQNFIQNGWHQNPIFPPGRQNFYNQYDNPKGEIYFYSGYDNPYSIWTK